MKKLKYFIPFIGIYWMEAQDEVKPIGILVSIFQAIYIVTFLVLTGILKI